MIFVKTILQNNFDEIKTRSTTIQGNNSTNNLECFDEVKTRSTTIIQGINSTNTLKELNKFKTRSTLPHENLSMNKVNISPRNEEHLALMSLSFEIQNKFKDFIEQIDVLEDTDNYYLIMSQINDSNIIHKFTIWKKWLQELDDNDEVEALIKVDIHRTFN